MLLPPPLSRTTLARPAHLSCLTLFAALSSVLLFAACDSGGPEEAPKVNVPAQVVVVAGADVWKPPADTTTLVVQILDSDDQPLEGITTYFRVDDGAADVRPGHALTDEKGLARHLLTFGPTPGPVTVRVWPEGAQEEASQIPLGVVGAERRLTVLAGDRQAGTVNEPLSDSLQVAVIDSLGYPVPDVPVSFVVEEGGGALSQREVATDAAGRASTQWTLGTSIRDLQRVRASIPKSKYPALFYATPQAGPPADMTFEATPPLCGAAGTQLDQHLAVRVTDAFENPVTGAQVSFSVVAGDGSVTHSVAETQHGVTGVRLTLGQEHETNRFTAQVGDLPPLVFEATSLFPAHLQAPTPTMTAVELAWTQSRNTEVASYGIHRLDSPSQRLGYAPPDIVVPADAPPALTDPEVVPGATYYYAIETIVSDACSIFSEKQPVDAGRHISFEAAPHDAVYDADADRLYVSIEGHTAIRVIDGETLDEVDRIEIGTQPNRLALSRDGNELLVTLAERAALQAIHLSTHATEEFSLQHDQLTGPPAYDVVEVRPGQIAASVAHISGGGSQVILLNRDDGARAHLAGAHTMSADAQLSVGPDRRYVYVADYTTSRQELFKLDLSAPEGPIATHSSHVGYAWAALPSADGRHVIMSGTPLKDAEAFVLDAEDLSVVDEIRSGRPAVGPQSGQIYMANAETVRAFDATSFEKTFELPVQVDGPPYLAISADETHAYIAAHREVLKIKLDR